MGKKKRVNKQLRASEGNGKDAVAKNGAKTRASASVVTRVASLESAHLKSDNMVEDAIGKSDDTVETEIVYIPEWRRDPQDTKRTNDKGRESSFQKSDPQPDQDNEGRDGGVKLEPEKLSMLEGGGAKVAASLLSRLTLNDKGAKSRKGDKKPGNRLTERLVQNLDAQLPSTLKPQVSGKPRARCAARSDVKISYVKSRSPNQKVDKPVKRLPIPSPTAAYLSQSLKPPSRLDSPQPLLVILDLNGTLLHRSKERRSKGITPRPYVIEFLSDIIGLPETSLGSEAAPSSSASIYAHSMPKLTSKTHPSTSASTYSVMIWSSARSKSVKCMCDHLLTAKQQSELVAVWARDRLRLSSEQFAARLPVYKQLKWVWASDEIKGAYPKQKDRSSSEGIIDDANGDNMNSGAGCTLSNFRNHWGQHNTVLLDDSASKAKAEPYNIIILPEFKGLKDDSCFEREINVESQTLPGTCKQNRRVPVLQQVQRYLEELSYQRDVSSYIRANPFVAEGYVAEMTEPQALLGHRDQQNAQ